jgi:predicted RNA-binding Zn ribbon-like protein
MATSPSVAEQLLLDLLNSTPIVDGRRRDELADPDVVRERLVKYGQPGTVEEAQTLLDLRPLLQDVVRGTRNPQALAPFIAQVSYHAQAADDGVAWMLEAPSGRSAAARVVLAWDELRRSSPGRLRACANSECRLFLLDRSKPNNARWCSMAACGNRMKARRHYQKAREATVPENVAPENAVRQNAAL